MKRVMVAAGVALTLGGFGYAAMAAPGGEKKVTICHIPPGNPANAHLITVGESAVPAHLAHGDPQPGDNAQCPASPSS